MKLYQIEMQVCATAYIKADSIESAIEKARALRNLATEDDVPISGLSYNDPELPDISLSPGMTIHGIWPDSICEEAYCG